jgi:hypothetical protein
MIADYSVGHTGSVHDSWAFRSTRTFKEHDQVFGPGEWLWADSAYPSEMWSVSPFKRPARGELSHDQKTFNYHLSKVHLLYRHRQHLLTYFVDPYPRRTCHRPAERQVPILNSTSHPNLHARQTSVGDHVDPLVHHLAQSHFTGRRPV